MARTINEIYNSITERFISSAVIKNFYGLDSSKTFAQQFLPSSLEASLFYMVATVIYTIEQQWEQYKIDLANLLRENRAHTAQWYATRAKEFQYGHKLIAETDQYDNSKLTEEMIEKARIVKFSASMETKDQSILLLKIATLNGGTKQPIQSSQLSAFTAYINTIKDAGVRIKVINEPADDLKLVMDIYYNPLLMDDQGAYLDGSGDTPVQDAIRAYIGDLSFNGLYTNQSLIDNVQSVEGVEIAELKQASSRYGTFTQFRPIDARSIPYAGYYKITDANLHLNFIVHG